MKLAEPAIIYAMPLQSLLCHYSRLNICMASAISASPCYRILQRACKDIFEDFYQDTESMPALPHSYQTWRSSVQAQKQKRPNKTKVKSNSYQVLRSLGC